WSEPEIDVAIRRYSHAFDFYDGIDRISDLRHRNVASFIGFCDEKGERMIVMEHVVNGSLDKYLNDPTTLTWSQRLHICFGAARALRYWHEKTSCVYLNKGGFKILLDKDWEARVLICCFESLYDTEFSNSNVYSFSVKLLEVLHGRKATIEDVNQFVAKLAKSQLDDIIPPNLRTQMHMKSLLMLLDIAYNCLNEQPDQHPPFMFHQVVEKLYEAFEIQWKHENPVSTFSFR
ncbi:protein STRUBBELIG-RECEPTOR FAMILY 8-like, partial [Bidens hawaiensis]|uniref:protein STRUBBELIG-RECEPTOR FAMILY 8-like n=1 Tax=Bidens hawaiensis TaxID=980011 RepID=UPI004049B558